MVVIIATAIGRWSCDPTSDVNSTGSMATTVVSDVIIIARRRLWPLSCIAVSNGIPCRRKVLMVSILSIESFTIMPHDTTMPIADIKFRLMPQTYRAKSATATSMGISNSTING